MHFTFTKGTFMQRILAIMATAALVAIGAATLVSAADAPQEVKLPNKMGEITFAHNAHAERIGDCNKCHHNGVDAGKCRKCHDNVHAPKFKDAAHMLCKDCHKKNGVSTGCKNCHVK